MGPSLRPALATIDAGAASGQVSVRAPNTSDATHVRNAVARFDQVTDVSDADRSLAFADIEKAARYYDLNLSETDWRQLGVHPQPHRKESARKGAETRMRTGEAEEAARKGAATRERLGIAEEAAKKAATTRRKREEAEGRREP